MYKSQCIHCIVLDPIYITPHNMKSQLNSIILENKKLGNTKLTNAVLQRMLYNIQNNYSNEEFEKLVRAIDYIRFLYYSKHLNLKFKVDITSFINIYKPCKFNWQENNNNNLLQEIKILQKINPDKYNPIILENKSHMVFNKIQPANKIIKYIKNLITLHQTKN